MPQKACERYIFHVMAYAIFFEMPHLIFGSFSHFSYLILKMGKMGHFRKNEHKKRGISKKIHVINFKRENEPKMKWGISKKIA